MKTKMNYLTATLLAIFAWGGTGVGMAKQSKKALRHPVEDNKKSPGVYDANQNDRQGIQDAEQGPGDKPVTWSISRPNAKNALSEVTKGIYQIHGGGFPNITIIEGREGIMIIAPFVPKETMAESLDLYYRKAGKRPIKAVVDAHPHTNYFAKKNGIRAGHRRHRNGIHGGSRNGGLFCRTDVFSPIQGAFLWRGHGKRHT